MNGLLSKPMLKRILKFHNLEVNELDGLAIMSDTDNSKMKSIAYFKIFIFRPNN